MYLLVAGGPSIRSVKLLRTGRFRRFRSLVSDMKILLDYRTPPATRSEPRGAGYFSLTTWKDMVSPRRCCNSLIITFTLSKVSLLQANAVSKV